MATYKVTLINEAEGLNETIEVYQKCRVKTLPKNTIIQTHILGRDETRPNGRTVNSHLKSVLTACSRFEKQDKKKLTKLTR
jgi:hypothetical protein